MLILEYHRSTSGNDIVCVLFTLVTGSDYEDVRWVFFFGVAIRAAAGL